MAIRKYTRKQLKQPDKFITTSDKAWNLIKDHTRQVLVMVGVAAVGIAGAWVWTYFSESKGQDTTARLTHALKVYAKPVVDIKTALPKDEDGVPRFKTKAKKLEATVKELSKVAGGSSSGDLNLIAVLVRGGAHLDAAQYTEAIKDYTRVLKETDNAQFRQLATEGMIYCYEGTKALDKALEFAKKLPRDGEKQYMAMYHEARILTFKGQKVQAAKLYQEIVKKATSTDLTERAGERLALLESK